MSGTDFTDSASASSASTPQICRSILSVPSVSVKYSRSVNVGLYMQEGKDIKYASLDRVEEIISHMPEKARRTLLAPIEQGLIDPQSVFYLIDDQRQGQIAICVEDFVQLASTYSVKERVKEDDPVIPPRLLDALRFKSEDQVEVVYSSASIYPESSSGYSSHTGDQSRSRGESALTLSKESVISPPELPKTRPPAVSITLSMNQPPEPYEMVQPTLLPQLGRRPYLKIFLLLVLAVFLILGIAAALYFPVFLKGKENTSNAV